MIKIVIAGAGFAGLKVALDLETKFKNDPNISIILADRHDYHLFTPDLFEVAAAEEEFVTLDQLKKSVALPIQKIIAGKNIKFLKGEISGLDAGQRRLKVGIKQVEYDYLVLALGNCQSKIKTGFGCGFETLGDALRIKNQVEFAVESHRYDPKKKEIKIVVVGGGCVGASLAGELSKLLDVVAWKCQYPREKITLEILEAQNRILPDLDEGVSQIALNRLKDLNVTVHTMSKIVATGQSFVDLESGEKLAYDVLVWTGSEAGDLGRLSQDLSADQKGKIIVNEYLQGKNHHEIFAIGDLAAFGDNQVAGEGYRAALSQAAYLADALPKLIKNIRPEKYRQGKKASIVINIGGKWAIYLKGGLVLTGYIAYWLRRLAELRHFVSLMGFWKALKHFMFQNRIFGRND